MTESSSAVARMLLDRRQAGNTLLSDIDGKRLLVAIGIDVPRAAVVETAEAAVRAADGLGYPCAVKLSAPELPHKSEIGAVVGPLYDSGAVRLAALDMLQRADGRGLLLIEQWHSGLIECFLSLSFSPAYGPIVAFGLGGIWVEEYNDVVYRTAPVNVSEARSMMTDLRASRVLVGHRGTECADLDATAHTIARLSGFAQTRWLRENVAQIEINPLGVGSHAEPVALDSKVILTPL